MRREDLAEGVTLKRLRAKERQRRYRARLRGDAVPFEPLGPKLGFKQPVEHIAKRKRFAHEHYAWLGDKVSVKGGRTRALRRYTKPLPCAACGVSKTERHHIDGNTANNEPQNIEFLCRRCHMAEDGRLASLCYA